MIFEINIYILKYFRMKKIQLWNNFFANILPLLAFKGSTCEWMTNLPHRNKWHLIKFSVIVKKYIYIERTRYLETVNLQIYTWNKCFLFTQSFTSKQGLNGHIRIHGGGLSTKGTPSESGGPQDGRGVSHEARGPGRPSTKPPANKPSPNRDESTEVFPCKLCGR